MSPLKKKKPEPQAEAPKQPDLDAARELLEAEVDLHAGGSVHSPNVVAKHACDLFDKYRYLPAFQAIAEALVKTAK